MASYFNGTSNDIEFQNKEEGINKEAAIGLTKAIVSSGEKISARQLTSVDSPKEEARNSCDNPVRADIPDLIDDQNKREAIRHVREIFRRLRYGKSE